MFAQPYSKMRAAKAMTVCLAALVSVAVSAPAVAALPWGWSTVGWGNGESISADESAGTWTVTCDGQDLSGNGDQGGMVYTELTGDFDVSCRVVSVSGRTTDPWARGGIMARNSLAANSRNVLVYWKPIQTRTDGDNASRIDFNRRTVDGGGTARDNGPHKDYPTWMRLTRNGDTFRAYYSDDGTFWDQVNGPRTISMETTLYIGFAVCSHHADETTTYKFDNVSGLPKILNAGATDHTMTSATLNGTLFETEGDTTVQVYWGTRDAMTLKWAWEHAENLGVRSVGSASKGISGLAPDSTYYYRFYASNATWDAWAPRTAAFNTLSAFTWDGDAGDGIWGNATNWAGETVPDAAGESATFSVRAAGNVDIDGASYSIDYIDFLAGDFVIMNSGTTATLTAGAVTNVAGDNTLATTVDVTGPTDVPAGTLALGDVSDFNTDTLTLSGGTLQVGGSRSTAGAINALKHFGFHYNNDSHLDLNDNGGVMAATPYASALLTDGPAGRGLDFDNDNDFKATGAINQNDNYMNLFIGFFTPPETGTYGLRNAGDDDRAGIWLDLDRDGVFESTTPGLGSNRGEQLSWEDGGNKQVALTAGLSYMVAFTHREGGGGSRCDFRFTTPSVAERIIKPSDPAQAGLWSVREGTIDATHLPTVTVTADSGLGTWGITGNSGSTLGMALGDVALSNGMLTVSGDSGATLRFNRMAGTGSVSVSGNVLMLDTPSTMGTLSAGDGAVTGATVTASTLFDLEPALTVHSELTGPVELHAGDDDSSDGIIELLATNSYTGLTRINRAHLRADDGVGLPANSLLVFYQNNRDQTCILETSGTFDRDIGNGPGEVRWEDRGGGGGFAARGGNLTVELEGGADLTWTSDSLGFNKVDSLQFGSRTADSMVELKNNIVLDNSTRRIQTIDNTTTKTDLLRLSGSITGGNAGAWLRFHESAGNQFNSQANGGLLIELLGANTYAHNTVIEECALYAMEGQGMPTTSLLRFEGNGGNREAVLLTTGTFDRNIGGAGGEVHWNGGGGFAARGGKLTVSLEGGVPLNWSNNGTGFNNQRLMLNSKYADDVVELINDIELNNASRWIQVFDNSDTKVDVGILSGDISGTRNGDQRLFKQGPGVLWLRGTNNTWGQPLDLDEGVVRLDGIGNLSPNTTVIFHQSWNNPSIVECKGSITDWNVGPWDEPKAFSWQTEHGGFAAFGGPLTVSLEGGITLNWGDVNTGFAGRILQFGSRTADDVVTLVNDVALGGNRQVCAFDNPDSDADYAVMAGVLSGNNQFYKRGDGLLILTAENTYEQETRIYDGELRVDGSIRSAITYVSYDPGNRGVLSGTGTVDQIQVRDGGTLAPGASVGTLKTTGRVVMQDGSTYAWELGATDNDMVTVTGNMELQPGWKLKLLDAGGTPRADEQYDIFTYTGDMVFNPVELDTSEMPADWNASGATVEYDYAEKRVYLTGVFSTLAVANREVSDLTSTSAQLNGTLSCSGLVMDVWAYWGETDGGSDPGVWSNRAHIGTFNDVVDQVLDHAVSSFDTNTHHFFTFRATNATSDIWAAPSEAFTTLGPPRVDNGAGATDISARATARLRGGFLDHNRGEVTICWGLSDGGTNSPSDWDRAEPLGLQSATAFSTVVEGAYYPLTYVYRCYATNEYGIGWSDPASAFTMDLKPLNTPVLPVTDGLLVQWDAERIGIANGARVDSWKNSHNPGTYDLTRMGGTPTYDNSVPGLNDRAAVVFSAGGDDWFEFDDIRTIRTVFWVLRDSPGGDIQFMLGDDTVHHFHGDDNGDIWHPAHARVNIRNGTTELNGSAVNGTTTPLPTDFSVISVVTEGPVEASRVARDRGIAARSWEGEMAEILVYDTALSAADEDAVGGYLAAKYGLTTAYPAYKGPTGIAVTNGQSTERSLTTVKINGLISVSNAVYSVWAYWGTSDGGSNAAAWASNFFVGTYTSVVDETVSHTIGGLTALSTPFYTFRLSNAVDSVWAAPSTNVPAVTSPTVDNAVGAVAAQGAATLRGTLTAGSIADVYVYWGRSDGGMDAGAWDESVLLSDTPQGAFSTDVEAGYGFSYYYRCYATNAAGASWASASSVFITARPTALVYTYEEGLRGSIFLSAPRNDTRLNLGGSSYEVSFERIFTGDKADTVLAVPEDPVNNVVVTGQIQNWNNFPSFNGNAEDFVTAFGGRMFPRTTGTHNFRFSCDDRAWMWIDMDDNGVFDAGENVGNYDWNCGNGAAGGDGTKVLESGKGYNFVAMAQEFGGGQNVNWFVTEPGGTETRPHTLNQAPLWQYATDARVQLDLANAPASGVSTDSAMLNGMMTGVGWALDVCVHWGTTDGGTNAASWDSHAHLGEYVNHDGPIGHAVAGLTGQTGYFYTFQATNAVTNIWASPGVSLVTAGSAVTVSNNAALDVGQTEATLSGELVAGGAGEGRFYWGLSDGGASHTAWANTGLVGEVAQGTFTETVPVIAGATYHYRAYVTNATDSAWAPSTETFAAQQAQVRLTMAVTREDLGINPPDVGGCELWLTADDIDGDGDTGDNPADGDPVDVWRDKSGNGYEATRDGINETAYNTSGPNGRPVVTFSGDYLSTRHNFDDLKEYTVLSVARYTGGANYRVISSATRNWLFGFHNSGDERFHAEGWIHNTGSANTNWHLHAGHINGDADPKANVWKDGVRLQTDGTGSHNVNYTIGRLALGGYRIDSEESNCEVAELLIYNRVLSDEELERLGLYLDWKYGLDTPYSEPNPAVVKEARGGFEVWAALSAEAIADVTVNFDFGADATAYADGMRGSIFREGIYNDNAINLDGANYALSDRRVVTGDRANTILTLEEDPDHNVIALGTIQNFNQFPAFNGGIDLFATVFSGTIIPRTTGEHTFRGECDDHAWMYIDMAGDNVWDNSDRVFTGDTSGARTLAQGQPYNFIFMQREGSGGENVNWYVTEPGAIEQRVSTDAQPGMWNYELPAAGVNSDYTVSAASVVIPAGSLSSSITLTVIDDLEQEDDEAVTVGIGSLANAVTGYPDVVTGVLSSHDPKVTDDGGPTDIAGGSATLNGMLTMGDDAEVTMYWGESDSGTNHANWGATVAVGSVSEDYAFSTTIGGLTANSVYYYRCYATNDSNLAEDWTDGPAVFTTDVAAVSIGDVAVVESDSGTVDAAFTVSASALSLTNVQAYYTTFDGTAVAGADYTATSGMVTIAAGTLSTQVAVAVAGDMEFEHPPETFTVHLYNPTNATISNAVGTCIIVDDDAAEYLADFPSRLKITLGGYSSYETLTNFPALVRLGPAIHGFDYETFASSTGGDLRFSSADGTAVLNFEIENWNVDGESCIWVQIPLLPPGGTHIWARWGNHGETAPPGWLTHGSVWDTNYKGVWHANDRVVDSTSHRSDAMEDSAGDVAGNIAGGKSFNGSNQRVSLGNRPAHNLVDDITLSAWVNPAAGSAGEDDIISRWGDSYILQINGKRPRLHIDGWRQADTTLTGGAWELVTVTYDNSSGTIRFYLNGDPNGVQSYSQVAGINDTLYFGSRGGSQWFEGKLDEFRISDTVRSADWIKACYDNQVQGSTFAEYSDLFSPKGTLLIVR